MSRKARKSRQKHRLQAGPKPTPVKVQAQQASTAPPPKKIPFAPLLDKDTQFARDRQVVRELKRIALLGLILLAVLVIVALLWR